MSKVVFLVVFVAASMSCPAAVVFTENFEGATQGFYSTSGPVVPITGTLFNLVSGSIDVDGPTNYPLLCTGAAAGKCVDTVGGSGGTFGQEIQTADLALSAGNAYTLTFALGNWTTHPGALTPQTAAEYNQPHSATVRVALGTEFFDYTIAFDVAPVTLTRNFAFSGGSQKLSFTNTASDLSYAGLILDNITLADANVPEPSSIALLGGGLLALLAAARRRRRV